MDTLTERIISNNALPEELYMIFPYECPVLFKRNPTSTTWERGTVQAVIRNESRWKIVVKSIITTKTKSITLTTTTSTNIPKERGDYPYPVFIVDLMAPRTWPTMHDIQVVYDNNLEK